MRFAIQAVMIAGCVALPAGGDTSQPKRQVPTELRLIDEDVLKLNQDYLLADGKDHGTRVKVPVKLVVRRYNATKSEPGSRKIEKKFYNYELSTVTGEAGYAFSFSHRAQGSPMQDSLRLFATADGGNYFVWSSHDNILIRRLDKPSDRAVALNRFLSYHVDRNTPPLPKDKPKTYHPFQYEEWGLNGEGTVAFRIHEFFDFQKTTMHWRGAVTYRLHVVELTKEPKGNLRFAFIAGRLKPLSPKYTFELVDGKWRKVGSENLTDDQVKQLEAKRLLR